MIITHFTVNVLHYMDQNISPNTKMSMVNPCHIDTYEVITVTLFK